MATGVESRGNNTGRNSRRKTPSMLLTLEAAREAKTYQIRTIVEDGNIADAHIALV